MNYNVLAIPTFDKQQKRLVIKYPLLRNEFGTLLESLEKEQEQGTPLTRYCYKIRVVIASKWESGGARIITNFVITENPVFLLSIFDKNEKENIGDKEL